jgi:hypothetical protein
LCFVCVDLYGLGGRASQLQPVTIKAPALPSMQQLANPKAVVLFVLCMCRPVRPRQWRQPAAAGDDQDTCAALHAAACKPQRLCFLCAFLRADLYGLGGSSRLQPVTIKAPALRFMQQLDVLLQKILPKIRDRVKRRIMPMLVGANL